MLALHTRATAGDTPCARDTLELPQRFVVDDHGNVAEIENPEIAYTHIKNKLFAAVTPDCIRRMGFDIDVDAFRSSLRECSEPPSEAVQALKCSPETDVRAGVKHFHRNGICAFEYAPDPELYHDMVAKELQVVDRRFSRFAENQLSWERLDADVRAWVFEFMLGYFATFEKNTGEEVICVSNLVIDQKLNAKGGRRADIQKLHVDHQHGAGNEVVVAVDVTGHPLRTRYFMGSHDVDAFSQGDADADGRRSLPFLQRLQKSQGALGSLAAERPLACNATRVADLLLNAVQIDRRIHYVEAPLNGMIFDAGGLHSGNAVVSNGPRVFWTFRTRRFHDAYTEEVQRGLRGQIQDTWFPMRASHWFSAGKVLGDKNAG